MNGKLIIIEGLDGSGKSTQIELLRQRAKQAGKQVRQIKFPNYEEDSSALVRAYLSGELGTLDQVGAYAASVLYSVDRYGTWCRHMRDDYAQGCVFLLDRYTTANMYHQATKLPKDQWEMAEQDSVRLRIQCNSAFLYLEETLQYHARHLCPIRFL